MKIPAHRIIASTLGAVAVLGFAVGIGVGPGTVSLQAQVPAGAGAGAAPKAAAGANQGPGVGAGAAAVVPTFPAWTAAHTAPQSVIAPQGMWGEVVASTPRWIVIQNQDGQQLPIASDRIRQFLVRWPASVNDLTPQSMVEATGFRTGQGMMAVDHIDIYEANAQSLVTPTLQNLGGGTADPLGMSSPLNAANFNSINFETLNFGSVNWTELRDAGTANWTELPAFPNGTLLVHVVGTAIAANPVTLANFAPGATMTVSPGQNGMSVTQVTLGTNTYAKKGDMVHLIPDNATPRGLDVTQMVLYKKIPLRQFQP